MTETDHNISDKKLRLTIRFGRSTMAFAVGDPQENGMLVYEPYEMKPGISMAANLRCCRAGTNGYWQSWTHR